MTEPTFDIMIWRHRNRLTQKQFAQLAGVHEATVYRWESGGGVRRKAWPDIDDYNAGTKCIVIDRDGNARFEPMTKADALRRAGEDVRVSATTPTVNTTNTSAVDAILSAIGPERLAELVAQHISACPQEKKTNMPGATRLTPAENSGTVRPMQGDTGSSQVQIGRRPQGDGGQSMNTYVYTPQQEIIEAAMIDRGMTRNEAIRWLIDVAGKTLGYAE